MSGANAILSDVERGSELWVVISTLDYWGFDVANMRISLWTVIVAVVVLILALVLARIAIRWIGWLISKIHGIDSTQQLLANKLVAISVWTITFLLAIDFIGIDLTALAVFSGALGLALGFGLQKTFGNLLAGIILLMDRSIKPGDVIGVNDGITATVGQVKKIGIRAVSVITRDKKEYLIPNENLMINQVENWSYSSRDVRIQAQIAIAHGCDIVLAEQLMLRAARETKRVLEHPAPAVWLDNLGRDAIEFEVHFWISDPEEGIGNVRSDLLKLVWRLFCETDIKIPHQQYDLNMRDTPAFRDMIDALRDAPPRPRGPADPG